MPCHPKPNTQDEYIDYPRLKTTLRRFTEPPSSTAAAAAAAAAAALATGGAGEASPSPLQVPEVVTEEDFFLELEEEIAKVDGCGEEGRGTASKAIRNINLAKVGGGRTREGVRGRRVKASLEEDHQM